MVDPLILAYGKGQLAGFCVDSGGVVDLAPSDCVVNATLACMPHCAGRNSLEVGGREG